MHPVIIVEGKRDKLKLRQLLHEEVTILCTYGIPNSHRLEMLRKKVGDAPVYLFTDHDAAGRRIRGILAEVFPDAEHIYTRRGYNGVEGTPLEYLYDRLEKAGLEEYLRSPLFGDGLGLFQW